MGHKFRSLRMCVAGRSLPSISNVFHITFQSVTRHSLPTLVKYSISKSLHFHFTGHNVAGHSLPTLIVTV